MMQEDAAGWLLDSLSNELQLSVLDYVDGKSALRAGMVSRRIMRLLVSTDQETERWWRDATIREMRVPGVREVAVEQWKARYQSLQAGCRGVRWIGPQRRHGLQDRVAAPQMFVGPLGRRLFCYGGWTRRGPQTDLHSIDTDVFSTSEGWDRRRVRFDECLQVGTPVTSGAVQTLTPLWMPCGAYLDAPTRQHVALSLGVEDPGDAHLVLAFGGGGGGYHNEHGDWKIAAISESSQVFTWTNIGRKNDTEDPGEEQLPRCAHTATYVPSRLSPDSRLHPQGCVFVIGGHTENCSRSLDCVDCLDVATWTWELDVSTSGEFRERHGHSATLVEIERRAYIVVVGGGIGNILHAFGEYIEEFEDACVFDVSAKRWLGGEPVRLDVCFGRHHTASPTLHGQAILYGGGATPSRTVGLLDAKAVAMKAIALDAEANANFEGSVRRPRGSRPRRRRPPQHNFVRDVTNYDNPLPNSRKMHAAACLLPWHPAYVCFGGWETGPHFADLWLAEIETGVSLATTRDEDDGQDEELGEEHGDGDGFCEMMMMEENEEDSSQIVTLDIATENGTHQIQVPLRVYRRLVRDGVLGVAEDTDG